ncbi:MAG: hypothetical protein ACRBBW_12980 [Cellvibrionaceae bacterium]
MSSHESQMHIWGHASKTDPSATKESNTNGHRHTSISGYWMIQKATELWGPLGKGWGYEILEDRIDIGGPIFRQQDEQEVKVADTQTHTIKLKLWYMLDGDKCELVQYGHTPYVYRTKYGATTDAEAPKKSLTDALKKALSMLGFCADVYLGQFDDRNYVDAVRAEFDIAKADDADEAMAEKIKEFTEWAVKELETYPLIPNKAALKAVLAGHLKRVYRQCPAIGMNSQAAAGRFQAAHDNALSELEAKEVSNAS